MSDKQQIHSWITFSVLKLDITMSWWINQYGKMSYNYSLTRSFTPDRQCQLMPQWTDNFNDLMEYSSMVNIGSNCQPRSPDFNSICLSFWAILGNFVQSSVSVSFGWDAKSCRSRLHWVFAWESKISNIREKYVTCHRWKDPLVLAPFLLSSPFFSSLLLSHHI